MVMAMGPLIWARVGEWGGWKVLTSQEEVERFSLLKSRSSLTLGRPNKSFYALGPFYGPTLTGGPLGSMVAEEVRNKLFFVGGL